MKVMIFTRRRLAVLTSCLAAGLLVAVLAAQGLSVVTAASRKLLPVYSVETAEKKRLASPLTPRGAMRIRRS